MIVKICGVRDPEVVDAAVDAGADWLGIVLEPRSPRFADDATARRVVDAARGRVDLVGVFVDPDPAACDAAADRYRLQAVQVHGAVAPGFVERCGVTVIRGYNMRDALDALTLQWWPGCLVLLDAAVPEGELPGGTGRRVAVETAAEVARHRRVLLAGGLTADTVADAIRIVQPEGVDASSGLERVPGVKDPSLVTRFVASARRAFNEPANGS